MEGKECSPSCSTILKSFDKTLNECRQFACECMGNGSRDFRKTRAGVD